MNSDICVLFWFCSYLGNDFLCFFLRHKRIAETSALHLPEEPLSSVQRRHSPLCIEKEERNSLLCVDSLLCVLRRSLPPLQIAEGHSTLCREDTLSSVLSRSLPPLHIAEGHSFLCAEKTLSPLYREGGGKLSPLCG